MFRSSSPSTDAAAAVRDRGTLVVTTARDRVVPAATAAKVAAVPVIATAALSAREHVGEAAETAREVVGPYAESARSAVAPYAENARSAVAPYLEESLGAVGGLLGEARHRGGGAVAALRGDTVETRLRWPFAIGFLAAGALAGAAIGILARRMSTPVPPAYLATVDDDSDPLATPPGVAASAPQAVAPHRA